MNNTQTQAEIEQFIIGCGCYLKNDGFFCSRSCRNAAFDAEIICDDDIEYEISNCQLKKKSFDKLKLNKKITNEVKYIITKKYYSDGTFTQKKETHTIVN